MKITFLISVLALLIVMLVGNENKGEQYRVGALNSTAIAKENTAMKVNVQIGNSAFTATMENNSAAKSVIEKMQSTPIVIKMSDYSGFEKVGSLGLNLPTSDRQTSAQSGDIVLYNGNKVVIFYGSHAWSYTRLGKIDDLSGWREALGSGDVEVTFSLI